LPKLFNIGGYTVFFWSNENNEPVHVHISEDKPTPNATKIWLTKNGGSVVAHNKGQISNTILNKALNIVAAQHSKICREWKKRFEVDEIKFYC
jgi:hypothetical protein